MLRPSVDGLLYQVNTWQKSRKNSQNGTKWRGRCEVYLSIFGIFSDYIMKGDEIMGQLAQAHMLWLVVAIPVLLAYILSIFILKWALVRRVRRQNKK